MLEDALDGQDFHSGFGEAAGPAATAAARGHTRQSAPTPRPGGLGGEVGQWGMGGLEALHDHLHCSEGMLQEDIQDPESRGRTDVCSISKNMNSFGYEGHFGAHARPKDEVNYFYY